MEYDTHMERENIKREDINDEDTNDEDIGSDVNYENVNKGSDVNYANKGNDVNHTNKGSGENAPYEVDLSGVYDVKELHERIRAALPVPEWYGNNLDALHDFLTERCDITVRFINAADFKEAQPRYASRLERLCLDCGAKIV